MREFHPFVVPANRFLPVNVNVNMGIRPFEDTDRALVEEISEGYFRKRDPREVHWQPCQHIESLERDGPKYVFDAARIAGYAATYALDQDHFRLNLLVSPDYIRQGIGSDLLARVESESRSAGGKYLQARVQESVKPSVRFAVNHGFVEIHRMREMTLDAGEFPALNWSALGGELDSQGYSILTLSEVSTGDAASVNKLKGLMTRAREGWPSPDPTQHSRLADGALDWFFAEIARPERVSIMTRGDQYVAFTSVDSDNHIGTAVHPDHRGQGIATYLKARNIRSCLDLGRKRFVSCSANPAMQKVNLKLGYVFGPNVEIRYVKQL